MVLSETVQHRKVIPIYSHLSVKNKNFISEVECGILITRVLKRVGWEEKGGRKVYLMGKMMQLDGRNML